MLDGVRFERIKALTVLELQNDGESLELEERVAAHWQDMLVRNPSLFNGPVMSPVTVAIRENRAEISVRKSSYANYMYARHCNVDPILGQGTVFVSVILPTSKEGFVVGRMAAHTSSGGLVQLPGGGVETIGDLRLSAVEEVKEELGLVIQPADLNLVGIIVRDKPFDIGVVYQASTHDWSALSETFGKLRLGEKALGKTTEFDRLYEVKLDVGCAWREGLDFTVDYLPDLVRALQRDDV